ncbi:MAG: sigma-54-dependent Fis family transcriptional regulator, partial [Planctomycetaceae bacterium]|nr:sigma-54-dependent Fis family transcriptional regulator [Planctomycetaceae bacterium]
LFIDEIGELPGALQPKLLRALEDGSIRRVGSHRERKVDVRLIAATNRTLVEEVAVGRFREDLYYRINVMSLELPPLRKREGDVALLIRSMLGKGWTIADDAKHVMEHYQWPGNVRQLKNAIERAQILANDNHITIDDLPSEIVDHVDNSTALAVTPSNAAFAPSGAPTPGAHAVPDSPRLDDLEKTHIVTILGQQNGNKARTARILGIHRRKLYRLLERYGITD